MSTFRNVRNTALVGVAAFGLAATAAIAQSSTTPSTSSGSSTSMQQSTPSGSMSSSAAGGQLDSTISQAKIRDLVGKEVVNADGKKIGKVSEIAHDQRDQSLRMVVATGGHLGLGEKHMALPLSNARLQGNEIHLTKELSQQQIQQDVASYDKNNFKPVSGQQREETVAAAETGSSSSGRSSAGG